MREPDIIDQAVSHAAMELYNAKKRYDAFSVQAVLEEGYDETQAKVLLDHHEKQAADAHKQFNKVCEAAITIRYQLS